MAEMTLDERFAELRSLVDSEIAQGRRALLEELTRAVSRMRSATNEDDWKQAVMESGRALADDAAALELLAKLAALTAPATLRTPAGHGTNPSAERFARVKIAEIQLYQRPAVKAGRAARDLYGALQPQIDAAREAFQQRFLTPRNGTADHLHTELVRELANNDAALLGPGYPGPLA
jgi:hypothetical protein